VTILCKGQTIARRPKLNDAGLKFTRFSQTSSPARPILGMETHNSKEFTRRETAVTGSQLEATVKNPKDQFPFRSIAKTW
jgi:hypothetical protein